MEEPQEQEQLTKKERRFLRRQERKLDNVRETRKRTIRHIIDWSATVLVAVGIVLSVLLLFRAGS